MKSDNDYKIDIYLPKVGIEKNKIILDEKKEAHVFLSTCYVGNYLIIFI